MAPDPRRGPCRPSAPTAWPSRPRARPTARRACWSTRTSPMPARSPGTRRCCRAARAGMWPAASFPARPSCCTASTPTWAGPTPSTSPDLADVYRLVINPANAGQYRLDGRWRTSTERRRDPGQAVRAAVLDLPQRGAVVGARAGGQDRSRRLRHPLRRHGRNAPAAAVLSPQQGGEPRPNGCAAMRAAGAAEHQLHLRRRDRDHRLRLQRPVSRSAKRACPGRACCPATAPI